MSAPSLAAPKHFDEFRVAALLGEGAMGQVFLCEDTALHRRVAVKFLKDVEVDPRIRDRFWTEARAIARLSHPNVVTIYRVGEVNGTPYLASEFIDGTSLDKLPLPVPWQQALQIGIGLARGLAAAHQSGVLHRDIKPANIMLTTRGDVKLLDFGLAKLVDSLPTVDGSADNSAEQNASDRAAATLQMQGDNNPGLDATIPFATSERISGQAAWVGKRAGVYQTALGEVMGTPLYMAPEAWRGELATTHTDIYSLGAVLYELVTGRPPHDQKDIVSLRDAVTTQPVRPLQLSVPAVDSSFAAVVDRCLLRSAIERFFSGDDLLVALERIAAVRELPTAGSGDRSLPRRHRVVWAIPILGIACIASLGLWWYGAHRMPTGMALIPGGSFMMGSSAAEIEAAQHWCQSVKGDACDQDERNLFLREEPLRRVEMTAFRIDRTEVTNQEFTSWLNKLQGLELHSRRWVLQNATTLADIYPTYEPFNGFVFDDKTGLYAVPKGFEHRPVTQITWFAAKRYCEDHSKRLPTEAEWEYAARGVEGRRFPWGFAEPRCDGVITAQAAGMPCAGMGLGPRDVGSAWQDVTPEGVYDLAGNVLEWVQDPFVEKYPACATPCRNPQVPEVASGPPMPRVVRGGVWSWAVFLGRGATRSRELPHKMVMNIGFRCAAAPHG